MMDLIIFEKYKKVKKKQSIIQIILIVTLLVGLFFSREFNSLPNYFKNGIAIALSLGLISIIIYMLITWRCPKCNAYLGRNMNPKYCKKCGVQLVEYID